MDLTEKLAAIEAIKVLKSRYFQYVDTKNWAGYKSLFTPDAKFEFPDAFDKPLELEEALKMITQTLATAVTIHHGYTPEIEILSEKSARGIWAMEDRIYRPESEQLGFGHYRETYECVDGNWRIKTLRLTRLRMNMLRITGAFS